MPVWKAVVLLNLALALGVGWGWAWWGRRAIALEAEVIQARAQTARLTRELEAARATPGTTGVQQWDVRAVVRAVLPEMHILVVSHEDIPGYMPAMTMGFPVASPAIHESVAVGDAVRLTLRGTPPDVVVTAIARTP